MQLREGKKHSTLSRVRNRPGWKCKALYVDRLKSSFGCNATFLQVLFLTLLRFELN